MSHTVQSMLVAAALAFAPCVARAAIRPSEAEWRRVLAGEYVVHTQREERGDLTLIGGTAWLRVEASAEDVWEVVQEPGLYRHLLPYAVQAVPEGSDVVVTHKVIMGEVAYRLRFQPQEQARVLRFWVPEAWGALRAGWGELRVQPINDHACVVTWSIMAHPDVGFLGKVFRGAIQRTMLDVPRLIRRFMASHPARASLTSARAPATSSPVVAGSARSR